MGVGPGSMANFHSGGVLSAQKWDGGQGMVHPVNRLGGNPPVRVDALIAIAMGKGGVGWGDRNSHLLRWW